MGKSIRGKARAHYGSRIPGAPGRSTTIRVNKTESEKRRRAEEDARRMASLSFDARAILFDTDNDLLRSEDLINSNDLPYDPLARLPPGEEGFFHSHEPDFIVDGGESDVELEVDPEQSDWEDEDVQNFFLPRHTDPRTRRDRVQRQVESWDMVLDPMVDAYLQWSAEGPPADDEILQSEKWEFTVVSFRAISAWKIWNPPNVEHLSVTFIQHGIIPASPHQPTLGFDIHLLQVFRQLHRVCPRLSIDGFAKALHHIHHIPFRSHLANQFRAAYDCFLEVMRRVRIRKDKALGRDSKEIRQQIQCPPCFYRLKHEPKLLHSFLAAMDGNNSLKMFDDALRRGKRRHDTRTLSSDQWLEAEEVDLFQDDVANAQQTKKGRKKAANTASSAITDSRLTAANDKDMDVDQTADTVEDAVDGSNDVAYLNINELDGLETCVNACVDRWKNAGPEGRKRMWELFAISGIFVVVCRHGHLLAICDMRKSGELMKYPIAMCNKLAHEYGTDMKLGYDIWCAFATTLAHSSIKKDVIAVNLTGVVPAFHGHAHNRKCQCDWHPMYVAGCGCEDFEGCERTFCLSNHLAGVTRMATHFHRRQEIIEHFNFQSDDKHLASGRFIFNNYVQALERIQSETPQLERLLRVLHVTREQLERDHQDEQLYLKGLAHQDSTEDTQAAYVALLIEGAKLREKSDQAQIAYELMTENRQNYSVASARSIETKWTTTYRRWRVQDEAISVFQDIHQIPVRWEPQMPEYIAGKRALRESKYRRALDELERLLIQEMLEMTKLNMSNTGYKMRDKISKALRTRAQAIRTALEKYNKCARTLAPPRSTLTFDEVLTMTANGDFDKLRDLRSSQQQLPWADPERRRGRDLLFRIKRAQEEIERLNIEIRRLMTFFVDDNGMYIHAITRCQDKHLKHALELERQRRNVTHQEIAIQLTKASKLTGFTGSLAAGETSNSALPPPETVWPEWYGSVTGQEEEVRAVRSVKQKESQSGTGIDASDGIVTDIADDVDDVDSLERMLHWWSGIS